MAKKKNIKKTKPKKAAPAKAKKSAPKPKKAAPKKPLKKKPVQKKVVVKKKPVPKKVLVKKQIAPSASVAKNIIKKKVAVPEKRVSTQVYYTAKKTTKGATVQTPPKPLKPSRSSKNSLTFNQKSGAKFPDKKGKKPVEVKKKKKVTLQSILDQPKPPIFVKKVELPKINYPVVTSGKQQYRIEYEMRSSPHLLYNYLSTASGLAAWFANDVNIRDGIYTFFWNGSTARAKIIAQREDLVIAYQWVDEPDNSYFVFEILQDDITGDVALIVTDFAMPAEIAQNRMLWNSQVHELAQVIGS